MKRLDSRLRRADRAVPSDRAPDRRLNKRRGNDRNNEDGFILPAAVMLVFFLTISGTTFFHLNSLEIQNAWTEIGKQSAFYLANTGIERSRSTFKISLDGALNSANWTGVLDGSNVNYPWDVTPNPLLCPDPWNNNCIIPPFQTNPLNAFITNDGDPVLSPDIPFQGTFDDGFYSARAFNNGGVGDDGDTDGDGVLTLRAMGNVREVTKVIEVDIEVTTSGGVVNCLCETCPCAATEQCPNSENPGGNTDIIHMPGRDPAALCSMPVFNEAFYRNPTNLPCSTVVNAPPGDITLVKTSPGAGELLLQSDTCYYATGNVTVKGGGDYDNVIVFSDGILDVNPTGNSKLNNSIMIGLEKVQLQGNLELNAPRPFPAVITKGYIDPVSGNSVTINGNVYAEVSVGTEVKDWNPNQIHGIIYGGDVYLKSGATEVNDDGIPGYYDFMPGFEYSDDDQSTVTVANTWREIR